jgi:peroxiredoxin
LNELQAKFKSRLVVIGLSDEPIQDMKKMSEPRVNYYVATDTQARTMKAVGVEGIPHSILIDPKGIVRYEGVSVFLDETRLAALIAKYSD